MTFTPSRTLAWTIPSKLWLRLTRPKTSLFWPSAITDLPRPSTRTSLSRSFVQPANFDFWLGARPVSTFSLGRPLMTFTPSQTLARTGPSKLWLGSARLDLCLVSAHPTLVLTLTHLRGVLESKKHCCHVKIGLKNYILSLLKLEDKSVSKF